MKKIIFIIVTVIVYSACTYEKATPFTMGCDRVISYNNDIRAIIDSNCVSCHDATSSDGDFTGFAGLKLKADNGSLYRRVVINRDMPEAPAFLSTKDVQTIKCWIDQGARYN